ncbi:retrovirus-related pol polyprotein from transposon TNT 1-94 [Tanacetum coccineum]|uniref:Retrovirus-related pol polyprotein from transposon TNT 1-94 n=1 Tax=Tanacetum coccineum TaxID=301880 RepID=A0ABQ5AH09_9ASTR
MSTLHFADTHNMSIEDIDKDAEVTLVDETQERNDDFMFNAGDLDGEKVVVAKQSEKVIEEVVNAAAKEVSTADLVTTTGEVVTITGTITLITLAQALTAMKSAKPKVKDVVKEPSVPVSAATIMVSTATTTVVATPSITAQPQQRAKGIAFREPVESTVTTTVPSQKSKDKGKAIKTEPEVPLKKKDQLRIDEELAIKLEAKEQEVARLEREEAEKLEQANLDLIKSWDNVLAIMEANRLLAERLQTREQGELTDKQKAKLFVELLEKHGKHFAALRAQEQRNKPPTKAQKKSQMSTYLKHMAGYKQSQLKNKSFAEIQSLFDKEMKRVNTFIAMDLDVVESSRKKDDSNDDEVKQCFEIVPEEEVAINAIPLATKPAPVTNFQIHKKGRNSYYEIMRADGSAKTYLLFSQLLKEFDREDLENLWRVVKAKYGYTMPEEAYERVLWGDLKVMFEPELEDAVWQNLLGQEIKL